MTEDNTHAVVITDQAFNALMLVAEEGMSKEQAAYSLQLAPWEVNYHIKQTLYLIDQARRNGFRVMRTRTQPSQRPLPMTDADPNKEPYP
jgi:hypothetical protein